MGRRNQGPKLRFLEKRGCFYITWSENGRSRERSTGTTDRRIAESALAEFIHGRQRKAGPRSPDEVLVTDCLIDYAENRKGAVVDLDRIAYALIPLAEFWEGKTGADVNRKSCTAYTMWRERSDGTVRRELGVLKAAGNLAHNEGYLTRPFAVTYPDKPEPKDRWLTRKEVAALLRAARNEPTVRLYLPLFILIALRTGARKEAILSLRWSQVDLEAGRIDFNPVGRRRTNKRRSRVPIPSRLLLHLKHARRRGHDLGYVIHKDGRPLKDIKKGFAGASRRAGLEDVSPHVLRHTCATWMMQSGLDMFTASRFLSMTMETLERTYAHHHPDHLKRAAEAF